MIKCSYIAVALIILASVTKMIEQRALQHYSTHHQQLSRILKRQSAQEDRTIKDIVVMTTFTVSDSETRPLSEYCVPETDDYTEDILASIPLNAAVGRYEAATVAEWNVNHITRTCYHDFLLSKHSNELVPVIANLTSDICKTADATIADSIPIPECTLFDGSSVEAYVTNKLSYLEGRVRIMGGKYVLTTPRSVIPISTVEGGPFFAVSNDTCVKYSLRRRSTCSHAKRSPSGHIMLAGVTHKVVDKIPDARECVWTSSGFDMCKCDEGDLQADGAFLAGPIELQLRVEETNHHLHRAEVMQFCDACTQHNFISPMLDVLCNDKRVSTLHKSTLPLQFRYHEGRMIAGDYVLDPFTGIAGKVPYETIPRFEELPYYVYLRNNTRVLNCTLMETKSKSVRMSCALLRGRDPEQISSLAMEYAKPNIFDTSRVKQLEAVAAASSDFMNGIKGYAAKAWDFLTAWINYLVYTVVIILAILLYVWVWPKNSPSPAPATRILPHGTRITYTGVTSEGQKLME